MVLDGDREAKSALTQMHDCRFKIQTSPKSSFQYNEKRSVDDQIATFSFGPARCIVDEDGIGASFQRQADGFAFARSRVSRESRVDELYGSHFQP